MDQAQKDKFNSAIWDFQATGKWTKETEAVVEELIGWVFKKHCRGILPNSDLQQEMVIAIWKICSERPKHENPVSICWQAAKWRMLDVLKSERRHNLESLEGLIVEEDILFDTPSNLDQIDLVNLKHDLNATLSDAQKKVKKNSHSSKVLLICQEWVDLPEPEKHTTMTGYLRDKTCHQHNDIAPKEVLKNFKPDTVQRQKMNFFCPTCNRGFLKHKDLALHCSSSTCSSKCP